MNVLLLYQEISVEFSELKTKELILIILPSFKVVFVDKPLKNNFFRALLSKVPLAQYQRIS